jgi:O-antigen/teichoic acid export membrane protein
MRSALAGGRNALWAIAEYFGYPLLMFAATPLFLHLLGSAVYGQWMLLLTFNGLGGLAGMGMGTAATREVAAHHGRGDLAGAAAAARSCLGVTLAASGTVAAVIALGATAAPSAWFAGMGDMADIRFIAFAGAAMIAMEQIDTVFAGTIRGVERYDVSARLELAAKLATVLASVAMAALARSLAPIVLVVLALMVMRTLAKARSASRLLGQGALWPQWNRGHVRTAFAFGKWTWVQSIGAMLFATVDRLLVGSILGAVALAQYSVAVQLAQQVQTLPAAGAQVLLPRVSRLDSQGVSYRSMAIKVTVGVVGLASACALALILLGERIMTLWVGTSIAVAVAGTLSLLAVGYALLAVNVVPHYVLLGAGRARFVALSNLLAGVVAVAVTWFLIPRMGLAGAATGRFFYAAVTSVNILAMLRLTRATPMVPAVPAAANLSGRLS